MSERSGRLSTFGGDTRRVANRGPVAGYAIGILVIDVDYPMAPGNVANASTYPFPVLFKVLKGVSPDMIMSGDPQILEAVIAGGRELIASGARAVVGACGSFAHFQRSAAEAIGAPTFMSIMTQAPFILQSLAPNQKLGILAADARAITPSVLQQCGVSDSSRLAFASAVRAPEFEKLLTAPGAFSNCACEAEIVDLARKFVADNPDLGAILLQCSDLPPYAAAVQRECGLPVYDMVLLIEWLHRALVRRPYGGFY